MNTQQIKELSQKLEELNSEITEKENKSYIILASTSCLYPPIIMISLYLSFPIYLFLFPLILFATYQFIKNRTKEIGEIKGKIKQELINNKEIIVNYFNESVSEGNNINIKNIEFYYKKEQWNCIYNLMVSELSDNKMMILSS